MSNPSLQTKTSTTAKHPIPELEKIKSKAKLAITIGKTPDELYAFWRNFKNLASFMKDISDIEVLSETRSKWIVKLKSGLTVEWVAEITAETPGEMIAWKSIEGVIETSGAVWFTKAPADRGTVVSLAIDYKIPGGKLAEMAALFTGEDPQDLISTNLKRFKGLQETGVIATVEGQSSGREETKLH